MPRKKKKRRLQKRPKFKKMTEKELEALSEKQAISAFNRMIEESHTEQERRNIAALALMLGYRVVRIPSIRPYDILIKGKTKRIAFARARTRPPKPPRGPPDEDEVNRVAAMTFYMCWRFRATECVSLRYIDRHVALRICAEVLARQIAIFQ